MSDKFIPVKPLETAVLFLVFNRLNMTKQVFKAIRKAKPPRLYVAADGARENQEGEQENVRQVRDFILSHIDWECEVKILFREKNLGCKMAVSGAIDWFFANEEMGIILEDDCLPSQSFFWFCEELLQYYKDDERIFLISGDGRATSHIEVENSYDYVRYPLIWGWASWSRMWEKYDVSMSNWPRYQHILNPMPKNTKRHWKYAFNKVFHHKIDTWDYQLTFLFLLQNGISIVPKVNFITNIGFGGEATHTFNGDDKNANLKNYEMDFPLIHPKRVILNHELNQFYDRYEFYRLNIILRYSRRVVNKIARILIKKNVIR